MKVCMETKNIKPIIREREIEIPPLLATFGLFFLCKSNAIMLFFSKKGIKFFVRKIDVKNEIKDDTIKISHILSKG